MEAGAWRRVPAAAAAGALLRPRGDRLPDRHDDLRDDPLRHRHHAVHGAGRSPRLLHRVLLRHVPRCGIRLGISLLAQQRQGMDPDDALFGLPLPRLLLLGDAAAEHRGSDVPLPRCDPVHIHPLRHADLALCLPSSLRPRHYPGPQLRRNHRRTLSGQCDPPIDTGEAMVRAASCVDLFGRCAPLRLHLYRDVLCLHLLLELQILLCVRLHVPRLHHPYDCDCLRHHRRHLLPPE
mmetsp:Transcript_23365/g.53097  ORF Transcript_23365/g.53097 Transcript_23365/m.53097 type:complete len:236 (+) Transcript_23365:124-831(+)